MILKKNYNWVIFNFDYIQHNEFMCVLKVKFLKSYSVSDSDGYLGITQWFNHFFVRLSMRDVVPKWSYVLFSLLSVQYRD